LREAACIQATALAEVDSIRKYGLKAPVCLIPNGIELPQPEPVALPPWEGIVETGKKVLLYLGRLHPKKGLPSLIRALSIVRARKPDWLREWILIIAGWDQSGHESALRTLVDNLNLADCVTFRGPMYGNEKWAALHNASAFVLPSMSEGFPMVVLDAWAVRCPVLMTVECHLPEGFSQGAAIEVGTNPETVARGLEVLFGMSDAERQNMGNRGAALVAERFTWDRVVRDLLDVYRWTLGGGYRPSCIVDM